MILKNEGYIKFDLNWKEKSFDLIDQDFSNLNQWRQKLFCC